MDVWLINKEAAHRTEQNAAGDANQAAACQHGGHGVPGMCRSGLLHVTGTQY